MTALEPVTAQVGTAPSPSVPAVRRPPVARPQQRPTRDPHWMLNQLPVGMLDDSFFVRFVSLFQELARPLLEDADNIEHAVDPTVAPESLLRWMGSWIGLDSIDPQLPSELQRLIVRSSARTLGWRGTKAGLTEFLEMTSGAAAEVTDGGGVWREGQAPADPAFVRMSVAATGWLTEKDFIALLRDEIPAHVRAELWIAGRLAWSSATEAEL
ncbi:MAG TPA: phage tail protein [Jatrophihabitans sp.]|nr:phage tail protein [Jatrophihabitans sp.]